MNFISTTKTQEAKQELNSHINCGAKNFQTFYV